MTLPGDDLVVDSNGYDTLRITQSRDLDAPLEEVWKHIYQMDTCKAGFYSWMNFERAFGMNVDNAYSIQEMWQAPDGRSGSREALCDEPHPVFLGLHSRRLMRECKS